MPRVPQLDNFSVAPQRFDAPQFQASTPSVDPGAQMQSFGQAADKLGGTLAAIDNEALARANALRVDDAINQAREASMRLAYDKDAGYTNARGRLALERESGKPLSAEYLEQLDKHLSGIADGLGNDAQRAAFRAKANDLRVSFEGGVRRHESQEFQTYALSVREGTIANRMQEIGLNYNDPAKVDEAIVSIRAAAYDMATLTGKSAEWAEAQSRKSVSNAHKTALAAALDRNDVVFADKYLAKYGKDMDADDLLQARGLITKEMDLRVGVSAAADVVERAAPKMYAPDFERVVNITMQTESGGRRYGPDGKLLESSAGAKGEMQVMDATNGDPGFGVRPAKDNSPEERARVGRDYLAAMVREYDGDLAKAWAAYNAGPGALNEAIKRAEQSAKLAAKDPAINAHTWLDFMPAETRAYVTKNVAAYGAGGGQGEAPTLDALKTELRARPELAGNPARLKAAEAEVEARFKEKQAAIKAREEQGVAQAMRVLAQNGGDFNALPPAVRAMIPPTKLDDVMGFGKRIRDGLDETDLGLYAKLSSNPGALAAMTDDQFFSLRGRLSDGDFKHFAKDRAKARTGETKNTAADLPTTAIKASLDNRLRMIGMDPTPKDGSSEAARVGAIRQFIDRYVLAAQAEAGKKFTDAEVDRHVDALFMRAVKTEGVISDSLKPMMGIDLDDIPDGDKAAIKSALAKRGHTDPTDAQILNIYWLGQTKR